MTPRLLFLALALLVVFPKPVFAAPTEAEKAKKNAEKKLDAFEKSYGKDLSRKSPDKLEKDIEALDEALKALQAVDAAAAAALAGRRDALVNATREGVSEAKEGKATEKLEKKLAKLEADFDPAKKKLASVDKGTVERAKKELDPLIAALDGEVKKTWEGKRDAFFTKLDADLATARLEELRRGIGEAPPATVAPMAPTWCDGVLESRPALFNNYHPSGLQVGNVPSVEGLEQVISFSCFDPGFERRQQWVAAWRSGLGARGIPPVASERLLKLGAALFKTNAREAEATALCAGFVPLEVGTAEERSVRGLTRLALGCGSKGSAYALGDVDLPGGVPSQLVRAQIVQLVLTTDPGTERDDYLVTQASNVGVLRAAVPLDPAAFERELEALKLAPLGQARAIVAFFTAKGRLDAWVAAFEKLAGKLPALRTLVFDAPPRAIAAFEKDLPKTKPLIDLIVAMEAQRGTMNGCAQKLWAYVPAELQGKKDDVNAIEFDTPTGPLLTYALTLCGRNDAEAPVMETIFRAWAERTDAARGPIGAAYLGYVAAYNEAAGGKQRGSFDADRRGGAASTLSLPAPGRALVRQPGFGPSVHGEANALNRHLALGGGVVKDVEAKGATTRISFRTEKFKVPDYSCVETNKIDRITPEGAIVYRSACTKVGEHEETSTLEPIEVPAWASGGVKAGSYLTPILLPNGQAKGRGWILEAWDSKARGKRTSLFGVAL